MSIAFSEEEVAIYNKQIKHKYSQDNKASKLANQLSSSDSSIDADEYLGLARKALAEGEYTFSLKLCTQSLNHHGASSVVYEVVVMHICLLSFLTFQKMLFSRLMHLVRSVLKYLSIFLVLR